MITDRSYTPLFRRMLSSSIMEEPRHVREVWMYLLAAADRNGVIDSTIPALARLCSLPVEDVADAIKRLSEPDPLSRTPDEDGRRLVPIRATYGWRIVTFQKHRAAVSGSDVQAWLRLLLDEGAMMVADIFRAGKLAGWGERQIRRAKEALRITSTKAAEWQGGWAWGLTDNPANGQRRPKDAKRLLSAPSEDEEEDEEASTDVDLPTVDPSAVEPAGVTYCWVDGSTVTEAEAVRRIFDYWRERTGRGNRTLFTAGRRAKIRARLKDSTPAEIKGAIDACAASEFHQGANDRSHRYDDLAVNILKSREKVEWWLSKVDPDEARRKRFDRIFGTQEDD